VRTLVDWRQRFPRTRDLYLAYCPGAFAERMIGLAQLLFERPAGRRPALIGAPLPRADE
jgi:hypothetical protein